MFKPYQKLSVPKDVASLNLGDTNKKRKAVKDVTFEHVNGLPLQLPPLVFPFRRALCYMAYTAYMKAMSSKRPHACASQTCPNDETWDLIQQTVTGVSECDPFFGGW